MDFTGYTNDFIVENQNFIPNSNQFMNTTNEYGFEHASSDLDFINNPSFLPYDPNPNGLISPNNVISEGDSFVSSINVSPGCDSSSYDNEYQETILKFITQILMEENIEEQPNMFYDPLGLHSTEKSFYDVLGENYTQSTIHQPLYFDQKADRTPLDANFQFNSKLNSQLSANGFLNPQVDELLAQNMFNNSDSILQFEKGLEEASKFLPKANPLLIDLESNTFLPKSNGETTRVVVKKEKCGGDISPNGSKGRKNRVRADTDAVEERIKQSAVYVDESELSEMFDKVLLCTEGGNDDSQQNGSSKALEVNLQAQKSNGNGGRPRAKTRGKKKETVDLRALLILCAQAVSAGDQGTANKLLNQIRQHSSPLGDGSQRLAHYFANGLEARLAGTSTGTQIFYNYVLSKKTTAADILKSYHLHLKVFPFKKISMCFTIKMIIHKVAKEAKTLHIVDFGILYGFHWPMLIQQLSEIPGGPPKLRITGIEFPQQGFRPAERIEESGRRLAKYCERFGVPFEYNAIASQHWETIQLKDLKIKRNEVLAVNSSLRFKNLIDETVEVNCPRDAVLNLVKKMNPNIFVHTIVNGSYNTPFYVTRFREALFHFSALFDMFDINISRDSEERLMFEREFYGKEAMNVIACEGVERVGRPETYKQWQVRTMRAGFKSLPLDAELMKKFKEKLKALYHKDFVIDEDNNWMLQGWKGRIVYASSCWVPA